MRITGNSFVTGDPDNSAPLPIKGTGSPPAFTVKLTFS